MRATLRDRFPGIDGAATLPDELLDLHTGASSSGSARSSSGSRATCAPRRSSPRSASRSSTPSCRPAAWDRRRPGGSAARVVGARPAAHGDPVPRTQPVARLRGRLPDGPRVHPAARGRRVGSDPGTARRGPAQPRRGDGDDGHRPVRAGGTVDAPRRSRGVRSDGPDPAHPTGARPAAAATEPRTTRARLPRDRLGARSRGHHAAAARRARRRVTAAAVELAGGGVRRGPARAASRRWPATGGSSSWSMAGSESSLAVVLGAAAAGYRLLSARVSRRRRPGSGRRRAAPSARTTATRRPDAWERRARVDARRGGRSRRRAGSRHVRSAGAVRTVVRSRRPRPPGR